MNVTREKPTAVDKARKQQRGADHRLLGVEIAAVLPWRNGANTLVLRRTIGTAKIRRQGINRLRGQRRAARVSERLLPFEPRLKLRLARQDADCAHERIHGNGDSRQILRTRFETRQVPVHDERIAEDITQEAKSWHDRSVTEIVGSDVHHGNGECVAPSRPFNVDGPGQRMHEVEIGGRHSLRRRIEGEVRIERIARFEYKKLLRIYTGGGLDCEMIPVEAVRIVLAVLARLSHDHRGGALDVTGVRPHPDPTRDQEQGDDRHHPNGSGFHWMSSLYDPLPARLLPVGPPARSSAERHSQILLGALGKSTMAKGSAELSEFAPTKFELMIDAGAAKLSAVLVEFSSRALRRSGARKATLRHPIALQALGNVYRRIFNEGFSYLRSADCFLSDCRPLQAVKVQ